MNDTCATCGHPKSTHFNGRGSCREWAGDHFCLCSCFIRLRWDRWQPAKLGTQPAILRFRKHNNPTRWSAWLNRTVEFQVKGDPAVYTGRVDRVDPVPFVAYL